MVLLMIMTAELVIDYLPKYTSTLFYSSISNYNLESKMDYVPAHGDKTKLADREFISGARVFDGEDQGKLEQQGGVFEGLTW